MSVTSLGEKNISSDNERKSGWDNFFGTIIALIIITIIVSSIVAINRKAEIDEYNSVLRFSGVNVEQWVVSHPFSSINLVRGDMSYRNLISELGGEDLLSGRIPLSVLKGQVTYNSLGLCVNDRDGITYNFYEFQTRSIIPVDTCPKF